MAKPIAKAGNILSGHTVTHSDGNCFAQKGGDPVCGGTVKGVLWKETPFVVTARGWTPYH